MKIYVICPVRSADPDSTQRIRGYVMDLRKDGHYVFFPPDDAPQSDPTGKAIVEVEREAVREADEIHVFWDVDSRGSHFDLGMAVAFEKKIVGIDCLQPDLPGKTYWKAVFEGD